METPHFPSKILDRTTLVYALRNLGLDHPDVHQMHQQYFELLSKNAEKITGRGNIEVYIELAKTYHQAGLVQEALALLVDGEESLLWEAANLGFADLKTEIIRLAETW